MHLCVLEGGDARGQKEYRIPWSWVVFTHYFRVNYLESCIVVKTETVITTAGLYQTLPPARQFPCAHPSPPSPPTLAVHSLHTSASVLPPSFLTCSLLFPAHSAVLQTENHPLYNTSYVCSEKIITAGLVDVPHLRRESRRITGPSSEDIRSPHPRHLCAILP